MKTPAWQRKEGQSKTGGLNAKGRASYNASTGGDLKAPVKSGKPVTKGAPTAAAKTAKKK
jgi:hypothetical protein